MPCTFRSIALATICSSRPRVLLEHEQSGWWRSDQWRRREAARSAAANGASGSGATQGLGNDGGVQPSGSTVDDAGQADDAADASACASYSGAVDSYSANLPKAGNSGQIQFVLVSAQPAPPAKGNNTWTLKLLDASGAPIPNATFAIKTWMPMMRHGSSIAPTPGRKRG